jgi:hypothetical protein
LIQNRLPKSTTKTSSRARASKNILVATGPHEDNLRDKAGLLHYEIRRVTKEARDGTATYELTVFDDGDLLDKHVIKGKFGDSICRGIEEFVRTVNDRKSS